MTHPEELLAEYVNGSLSASDIASVEEHLAACTACSADVSRARAARSALGFLPEVPAPDGVASRALDAAARPEGRPGWYRWLGAGAAAAVVALVLLSLPHLGSAPATPEKAGAALVSGTSSPIAISDAAALPSRARRVDERHGAPGLVDIGYRLRRNRSHRCYERESGHQRRTPDGVDLCREGGPGQGRSAFQADPRTVRRERFLPRLLLQRARQRPASDQLGCLDSGWPHLHCKWSQQHAHLAQPTRE